MLPTASTFCKLYQCGDKLLFEYAPNTSIYSFTDDNGTTYYSVDPATTVTISINQEFHTAVVKLADVILDAKTTTHCIESNTSDCRYTFTVVVSYAFTVYNGVLPDNIIVLNEEPEITKVTEISLTYIYNHMLVVHRKLISLMRNIICECNTINCNCDCGASCPELLSYTHLLDFYELLFDENFKFVRSLYDHYHFTQDNFTTLKSMYYDIILRGVFPSKDYVRQYFLEKYIKFYTIEKILFNTGLDYFNGITPEDKLEDDYIEDKFNFTRINACAKKTGVAIEEPLNLDYKFNLLEATTFSTQYTIPFNSLYIEADVQGLQDGLNQLYTIFPDYCTNSTIIYLSGLFMRQGHDYVEIENNKIQFLSDVFPESNENLVVKIIPKIF